MGIYASVSLNSRNRLWNALGFIDLHEILWLVLCDFNYLSCADNKLGGRNFSYCSSIRSYNQFLSNVGLYNLGFMGPKYTWCYIAKVVLGSGFVLIWFMQTPIG